MSPQWEDSAQMLLLIAIFVSHTNLDSHADTIVTVRNCTVVHYTDIVCDVSSYYNEYDKLKGVPVVQSATGYTTKTGDNFILIHNKDVWMHNQGHSLINTNKLFHSDVEVQDNPYDMDMMLI